MSEFEGQTAVITGAAQGIGYATAEKLKNDGAKIVIWDMDKTLGEDAAQKLNCDFMQMDMTDDKVVEKCTSDTLILHGKIDVLVCSAGIAGPTMPTWDYPVDEWIKVMNVNVNGVYYCNRHVIKTMREKGYGRIVNIASIAGKEGNPNAAAYSASKAAVIALTKSLGKELSDKNIAVNCVTPAAAKTRIFDQISQEHIDYMLSKIPRGRFLKVDELASMVAWLVSEENSYTTGAVFDLSGGRATY
mgnify:CR=1 FL=1